MATYYYMYRISDSITEHWVRKLILFLSFENTAVSPSSDTFWLL